MSPSNTCSGSFWCTSNCVSKEKETRKRYFASCKIFLKQYFGLNFRRLEEKQEPKSRKYDERKRLNFPRFPGTSLNKAIGGRLRRSMCLIESPCSWCAWMQSDVKTLKAFSKKFLTYTHPPPPPYPSSGLLPYQTTTRRVYLHLLAASIDFLYNVNHIKCQISNVDSMSGTPCW